MDNLVTANIRQRPVRVFVSVAGVALGVCLVMLFTGLARGMANDLRRRSSNLRAELIFTRPGATDWVSSTMNLPVQYADELMKVEGVELAVPAGRYISQGGRGFGFEQVEGVDWEPFARMNGLRFVAGRAPRDVDEAGKAVVDEVIVDETKARNNNLSVGSTVRLFGDLPYRVVGIYTPEAGPRVKMSLAAMQDALESPGKSTWIYVKVKDTSSEAEVAERINQTEALKGNKLQSTREVFTNVEANIPFLGVFLRVLVVLAAVVSGLVIMLAMYTTITERTREIGILKALGASRGYIVGVIEKEAIIISLLGLAAGFAVSFAAGYLIHRTYGLVFEYSWAWGLSAALIGLGGGALGALYPAMRAANLDPVNALSYE